MAILRARLVGIIVVGLLGITACGSIAEPPPIPTPTPTVANALATEAPLETIPTPTPTAANALATEAPLETPPPTIAAVELPVPGELKYFWPSQSTLQLAFADWNDTGWDFTLDTPEHSYGEPEYIGLMLSGGSLAPELPELGQTGALVEPRTIRGLPGFYESGGFGFRLAWEEDGQRYSLNALGMTEEEALTIVEQLELLTAEEMISRLEEAK